MKYKILLLIFLPLLLNAQVITWNPGYVTESDSIEVFFHADQGNKGLAGFTGDVYAHTGVILTKSAHWSEWFADPTWGNNDAKYKLTKIDSDLYRFVIKTSIRDFYEHVTTSRPLTANDSITGLAFVFRNSNGSKVGKNADNSDIILPLKLGVDIVNPNGKFLFYNLNDTIDVVSVKTDWIDSMALFGNNQLLAKSQNDTLGFKILADSFEKNRIKLVGYKNDIPISADSFYYVVKRENIIAELPEGVVEGINYLDENTVTLVLYAPQKKFIYLIGDFNDWEVDPNYQMKVTPDGKLFWITVSNLAKGEEYCFQYLIDGDLRIADPYAEKILDPWNDKYISEDTYPGLKSYPSGKTSEIVSIFQTGQNEYLWQNNNFEKPDYKKLVIYEMWLANFI